MRIGIDARLWSQTGVGRYIRNLIEHLLIIDQTNEYVIFINSRDFEKIKTSPFAKATADKQKSKLKNTSKKFKFVVTDIRWHSVQEQIFFHQILNREKLDLMHFTYFSVPIFYDRPYVVTIHDLIINHFSTGRASSHPLPFYYIKLAGYKYVLSRAIRNAKNVIVPLNTVKDDLIHNYPEAVAKTFVTYEGADEFLDFKNAVKPDLNFKYFFYAGNAYPHKNLEKLLEGFRRFREKNRDVKMVLAGKEDYFYSRLRQQINPNGDDGVLFKFDLSDEELAGYYMGAMAYVSASRMEGFGLTPIEAASCGSVLVLSDIPAFREVWGKDAIYFDPEYVSDISDKLGYAFSMGSNEREKLVRENRERVKNFKWKKTAEKTLKTYEDSVSL